MACHAAAHMASLPPLPPSPTLSHPLQPSPTLSHPYLPSPPHSLTTCTRSITDSVARAPATTTSFAPCGSRTVALRSVTAETISAPRPRAPGGKGPSTTAPPRSTTCPPGIRRAARSSRDRRGAAMPTSGARAAPPCDSKPVTAPGADVGAPTHLSVVWGMRC
eukprot:366028-Chlamydomonas_euryale.AAC.21